jgi:hypothetical protein
MNTRHHNDFAGNCRGSVLIVALIFSAIIAISITSYVQLTVNAMRLADRSFYANGAQNLLDNGMEQVLWALNNEDWASAGFAARSGSDYSDQYQATYPSSSTFYNLSQGTTGQLKVWVDASTSNPHVVVQSTITLGDDTSIVKQAEAYLKRRSFFKNGIVARGTLRFVGNVTVDSWNSDPDGNPATAPVAYSTSVDSDGGRIASLSVEVASISVGNADVYGYAAIGSSDLSGIDVGATGRLGPYGTASGVIDASRVTYDFTTNFPDFSAPVSGGVSQSYTIAAVTTDILLPRTGDLAASDGKYYYFIPSITLNGSEQLDIDANSEVVISVTDTSGTTVQSTGNAGINIPADSTLTIYASANVAIGGNGVLNGASGTPSEPSSFQIYGTRTATQAGVSGMQSIAVAGNGYLSGVIYAPNANVSVNGNGDTYGAIIANEVSMNGNGAFHYDEALGDLATVNLWGLSKWREVTLASERASYADELNF